MRGELRMKMKPMKVELKKSRNCFVNLPIGLEKEKHKKGTSLLKKIKLKLIK
tara:strand:- start:225 stop:380 length:156 start_codon:yes stop_codon:yes gene_type:complete